jgi:hypothetical protein
MGNADRIGDWTLRHPVAVLSAFAVIGGTSIGLQAGGLTGALIGFTGALAISAFTATVEPIDPKYGPHQ